MIEQYYLHVLADHDQTEWRFSQEPDGVASLHVWADRAREYTATHDIMYSCDGCLLDVRIPRSQWKHRDDCPGVTYEGVKPPGAGWKRAKRKPSFMQLRDHRPSTVWCRKVVRP